MWVVKLGGSLWNSQCLADWLDRLANSREEVVVVPGGGPFADQVRTVQARWQFDDHAAHVMALHAMEQMARMFCALRPACATADSVAQIAGVCAHGGVPVWLPTAMVLRDSTVEADWSVTSDSLSLWLARRLRARGVVLVKSAALPEPAGDLPVLPRTGLVDDGFDRYRRVLDCPVWIMHREHSHAWPPIITDENAALAC